MIKSCVVTKNTALYYGGGIVVLGQYMASTTFPWLSGCTFADNQANRNPASSDVWANHANSDADFPVVLSACAAGYFKPGTGALACKGCNEPSPADLGGSCTACPAQAPYSCCGALSSAECSASPPTSCSEPELAVCARHSRS